jgi:23S rRNA (guanosine2251-2'-O)-methyltransferase
MTEKSSVWIGGKHSVEAAINNSKRTILKIVTLTKNEKLDQKNIKYEIKNQKYFNKIFLNSDIAHQGIAVQTYPLPNISIEKLILTNKNIIMLDGITDPMNIGSIIRNALAFDVKAIIVNQREYNEKSSTMIKASSGAIEKIDICKTTNLLNSIKFLKQHQFWITALDVAATIDIQDHNWHDKNLIIFGSEGYGIKDLIKKNCDYLVKIKINKEIDSLNVSSSVAVTLSTIYK